MANSIVSVEEEECKIRNELNDVILKGEKEHGPLAERLVTLEDQYKLLTELEQELMDIKVKGNIIAYEKGGRAGNSTGNSLHKGKSQRKEPGSNTDGPSTTYLTAQPMQDNLTVAEQNIKSNSNPDQVDTSHPEQSLQANQKESTSNRRAEKKSMSLGEVAWEQI